MTDLRFLETSEKQALLVRRYCVEAERLLGEAADYATALQLKESLCEQFQKECSSSLVVTATRQYIDVVIKERWGERDGETDTKVDSH